MKPSHVQEAGINVCAGVFCMGEQIGDHASMLVTLANLNPQPQSVPINMLIPIAGTPLGGAEAVDPILAYCGCPHHDAEICCPVVGGREWMSDETQALCFWPVPIRFSLARHY